VRADPSPANTNNWIVNNVMQGSGTPVCAAGNGYTFVSNMWPRTTTLGSGWNDVIGTATFQGGAANDPNRLRLTASSLGVNAAITYPWFATDFVGGARPAATVSDLGAFER
jgi:hypothetical protein